jgi:hypothetical protein
MLAALALLAAAAAEPAITADPDLRCVAATAAVLGTVSEAADTDAETITGITAIFMYFLGKVDARRPGLDYAASLTGLMNSPGYDQQLPADLKRCGAEAEERSSMLKDLGEKMKTAVPLAPVARAG